MKTVFNEGWWEEIFGTASNVFPDKSEITSHRNFMSRVNGDSSVLEFPITGLRIEKGSDSLDRSAIIGLDTFDFEKEFSIDFEFMFLDPSYVSSLNQILVAFIKETVDKLSPIPALGFQDCINFGVMTGPYAGGYPLAICRNSSSNLFEYWDGTSWVISLSFVPGVLLSLGVQYRVHLERTSDGYFAFSLFVNFPIVQKVLAFVVNDVKKGSGWFLLGSYWDSSPTKYSITLKSLRRGKGQRERYTFPESLPNFIKFQQMVRDKKSSFNRVEFDTHLVDGVHTFLPSLRFLLTEEREDDLYHTLTSAQEGRLDKVSYSFYGTTRLWWILAMVNKIDEPYKVKAGKQIRVPSITEMNRILGKVLSVYGK